MLSSVPGTCHECQPLPLNLLFWGHFTSCNIKLCIKPGRVSSLGRVPALQKLTIRDSCEHILSIQKKTANMSLQMAPFTLWSQHSKRMFSFPFPTKQSSLLPEEGWDYYSSFKALKVSKGRRNVCFKSKQSLELEDKRLNSLELRQCNSFPVFLNCLDTDLISISHESHHQVKNRRFKYEMLWWRKDCRFLPSSTK